MQTGRFVEITNTVREIDSIFSLANKGNKVLLLLATGSIPQNIILKIPRQHALAHSDKQIIQFVSSYFKLIKTENFLSAHQIPRPAHFL
jgi:hypothetical protein